MVDLPPEAIQMGFNLTDLMLRNTAEAVMDRVKAAKSNRNAQEQNAALSQIIQELIEDKNDLIALAQAQQEQLTTQNISEDDLAFINNTLIPTVEKLVDATENPHEQGQAQAEQLAAIKLIKSLGTTEMLSVLQLVGFSYRKAIGEPLTELVASLIRGEISYANDATVMKLILERDILRYEVSQDVGAHNRWKTMDESLDVTEPGSGSSGQGGRRKGKRR